MLVYRISGSGRVAGVHGSQLCGGEIHVLVAAGNRHHIIPARRWGELIDTCIFVCFTDSWALRTSRRSFLMASLRRPVPTFEVVVDVASIYKPPRPSPPGASFPPSSHFLLDIQQTEWRPAAQ